MFYVRTRLCPWAKHLATPANYIVLHSQKNSSNIHIWQCATVSPKLQLWAVISTWYAIDLCTATIWKTDTNEGLSDHSKVLHSICFHAAHNIIKAMKCCICDMSKIHLRWGFVNECIMQKNVQSICMCGIMERLHFENANDDKGLPEKSFWLKCF